MTANAFIGKPKKPTDAELAAALGPAKAVWDRLLSELAEEEGVTVPEWKCSSPKHGWSLRLKRKQRTIVWLAPRSGCFGVTYLFGEKAMQAARQAGLPRRVVKALAEAPRYPEGTALRLEVKTSRDIGMLRKLVAIKRMATSLANGVPTPATRLTTRRPPSSNTRRR